MSLHLNIGGVPEHFNLPWRLAIDDGIFSIKNIELYWKDYKGGTGDMCKALRSGQLDIAILLTEGIVKDIEMGNPSTIVQFYVNSPLIWGIHTDIHSEMDSLSGNYSRQFAISRLGSGSHLMAYLLAEQEGWAISDDQFKIVDNFTGALKAMQHNPHMLFLWEKYMTKPYVDAGQIKRIGEINTPWKSFCIAVRNDVLEKHPNEIAQILEIISTYCYKFKENSSQSIYAIANNFDLSLRDVKEWFSLTDWNYDPHYAVHDEIEEVKGHLKRLKLI